MPDSLEGLTPSGTIATGADRGRVPAAFEPIVAAATGAVHAGALYLYGSVATGQARVGASDVDVLTVDLPAGDAAAIARELSARFEAHCRGVEIAAVHTEDLDGPSDEAYGNRVFLRHYCVHLAGPAHHRPDRDFPADERAARGFNGDIAQHAERWRRALDAGDDPAAVARRLARKTLLATAGLVSVHDGTWTTDRERAARRWAQIRPARATGLATLLAWTDGPATRDADEVGRVIDDTVRPIVAEFASSIGLW